MPAWHGVKRGINVFLKRALGDKAIGAIDYLRYPGQRSGYGGAFNGQQHRARIFDELLEQCEFDAIVETGTFRGTTTEHLARKSRLPVYTVESNARFVGFARARLVLRSRVQVCHGDSRRFLSKLAGRSSLKGHHIFFYLDAHGGEDLPLRRELELILGSWPNPVIMIDDFRVPGDDGYGYDDDGESRTLDLRILRGLEVHTFFPVARSDDETGRRRGCVVTCPPGSQSARLRACMTLREWPTGRM